MNWLAKALEVLAYDSSSSNDICEKASIKSTEGDQFIEDDQTYPWVLINGYMRDSTIVRFIQEEEDI
jgi:hypothetical protein